ncbi:MAG TPA: type II secretion system protein [Terriglobia bacterium]|nr:type II secretion system protein [Terriglobia bacterium]
MVRGQGSGVRNPESRALPPDPRPLAPGFTLVELIATMAIMLILASAALPLARVHAERLREEELHRDLRELRGAIDRYKDFSDRQMIPQLGNTYGYPPDLDTLVNGVPLKGTADVKYKFLRKIPVDPMTGKADWGKRSMQDDPDSKSWGGEDVFDVYSMSDATALDGTKYSDW